MTVIPGSALPRSPSFLAPTEHVANEIVDEKGDGTRHANTQCTVARREQQGVPSTGSCADRQKGGDRSGTRRSVVVWSLFHSVYPGFLRWASTSPSATSLGSPGPA